MKKKMVKIGTGICVAAAAALILGEMGNVRASMLGSSSGLAGISLYIDQFYDSGSTEPDQVMRSAVPDQKADGETAAPEQEAETTQADEAGEPAKTAAGEETQPTGTGTSGQSVEEDEEEEPDEVPTSEFENVGVSIANNYVNIRKKPNTDSEIVGKLYKGCAATILKRKGDWVKIQSGNAKGYINAEYLAIGFDVDELVDKYGTKWAVVNTETLRVRIDPSTDSKIATLVPEGERLLVLSETEEWVEISIDDGDITGYVSAEFVNIEVEFEHAVTIEEEEAERRRQEEAEEALRQQEEAQRQQQQQQQQASQSSSSNNNSSQSSSNKNSGSSSSKKKNPVSNNSATASIGTSSASNTGASSNGAQIAAFAQKFVGYPYVYGGTSLTNGADCSGFVQSVYKSFGISIPRDSRSQCAGAGYQVSFDSLQPGDLIFYTNNSGTVNHVAMYIGGGQVVHASDPSSGIKISNMRYRTPYMARRVVN